MVLLFSVIVFGLFFWCRAQSPCPGTFDYQNDGTGVIRLQPHGPVSSVSIRLNFTIAVRLVSSYVGRVEPINPEQALQRFNQGSTLTYRVLFPVTSPLPRLTSLVVNNRELCFGPPDIPGPGQYVSTITLQHMLYSGNGGLPGNVIYDNTVVNPVSNQENFASSNSYGPNRFSDSNGFSGTNGFDGSVPVKPEVFTINDQNGNKGTYTYYTYKINRTNGGQQPGAPGQTIFFNEQTTQPAFVQRPQNQPDHNYFVVPTTQPPLQYITERITERPRPQRPQPPQWTQPPQLPPPDYKPYTTESPRPPPQPDYNPYTTESARPRPQPDRPPPDYNPYTTQAPQPEQPPPDFNPYDTNNNGQGGQQNPNIPQVPSRLPGTPNLSNHGECGVIAGGNEKVPLIFNGQSYERGDWPWLVAIYKKATGRLDFICSGTLISHKHVVTAAHCMVNKNAKMEIEDIVVKVGAYNLEDWGDDITQQRTLEAAVIHESFNTSTLANDILVLTVDRAVEFNVNIRPACLWSGKTDLNRVVGASGVVAGWGRSEFGRGGHGEPRMARIPVVSTAACRASRPEFHKLTSSNTLCAGDRNGEGPCSGDSGGGLYILESGRWRLRGVVSLSLRPDSGDSTCNLNEYLVFTDAAKYLKWVKDIVQTSLF